MRRHNKGIILFFIIFIIGAYSNEVLNYWTWLIMLSIFYVETTVTLLVRIKRRENALKVHHSHHAYQQIIISTGKHNRTALISIIIQSVWLIPMTLIASKYPEFGFLITLIVCLPLSVIFYFFDPLAWPVLMFSLQQLLFLFPTIL